MWQSQNQTSQRKNKRGVWLFFVIFAIVIIIGIAIWFWYSQSDSATTVVHSGKEYFGTAVPSPSSDYVVYETGGVTTYSSEGESRNVPVEMKIASLDFSEIRTLPRASGFGQNYTVFSPDGKKVLYRGSETDQHERMYRSVDGLYVYDIATKESRQIIGSSNMEFTSNFDTYAWQDNQTVVYSCSSGEQEGFCVQGISNQNTSFTTTKPNTFHGGGDMFKASDYWDGCFSSPSNDYCLTGYGGSMWGSSGIEINGKGFPEPKKIHAGEHESVFWSRHGNVYIVEDDRITKVETK